MTDEDLARLALEWANGMPISDVLLDAWSLGYGEGYDDGERSL